LVTTLQKLVISSNNMINLFLCAKTAYIYKAILIVFLQSGYQTELHLFGRDEDNQIPLMNTLISELKLSDKVKIPHFYTFHKC
jgi:hypothetical protein